MAKDAKFYRTLGGIPDSVDDAAIMSVIEKNKVNGKIENTQASRILALEFYDNIFQDKINKANQESNVADNESSDTIGKRASKKVIHTNQDEPIMLNESDVVPIEKLITQTDRPQNAIEISQGLNLSQDISIESGTSFDPKVLVEIETPFIFEMLPNEQTTSDSVDNVDEAKAIEDKIENLGVRTESFADLTANPLEKFNAWNDTIRQFMETKLTNAEAIAVARLSLMRDIVDVAKRAAAIENAMLHAAEQFEIQLPVTKVSVATMEMQSTSIPVTTKSNLTYEQILQLAFFLGKRGKMLVELQRDNKQLASELQHTQKRLVEIQTAPVENLNAVELIPPQYYILRERQGNYIPLSISCTFKINETPMVFSSIEQAAKSLTQMYYVSGALPIKGKYFISVSRMTVADADEISDETHAELNKARLIFESGVKVSENAVEKDTKRDKKRSKKDRKRNRNRNRNRN